jgi:hypothetical protein
MIPARKRTKLADFKCHIIETQNIKNGCKTCRVENEFSLCTKLPAIRGRILETPGNIRKRQGVVDIQSNIAKLLLDLGWLERKEEADECIAEIKTLVRERNRLWKSIERE